VGDAPLGTSPLPDLLVGPGKASSKPKSVQHFLSLSFFLSLACPFSSSYLCVFIAQSESMLLGKRSSLKDDLHKSPKSKKAKKETIGSALAVQETDVFRPSAHLAPSDVKFVSSDKKCFALHSFMCKMRYISHEFSQKYAQQRFFENQIVYTCMRLCPYIFVFMNIQVASSSRHSREFYQRRQRSDRIARNWRRPSSSVRITVRQ
jgi:hypothetical protein